MTVMNLVSLLEIPFLSLYRFCPWTSFFSFAPFVLSLLLSLEFLHFLNQRTFFPTSPFVFIFFMNFANAHKGVDTVVSETPRRLTIIEVKTAGISHCFSFRSKIEKNRVMY